MPAFATLSSRNAFLETLRTANVLTDLQQAKANLLAPKGTAAELAAATVSAGLLTRFQADRLLAGRPEGLLLGQHIVLDQIGRGTMSRVYKAKHRTMGRPVAIKILSAALTRTAAERQNFQREIRAAGKLAHTNIVTAYDASERHDRFYLVLEFVDGPNLEVFVRQRGQLSVSEACEFVRQIAAGLQHAHEKGMIHRDIKPANLLVARPTPAAPLTVKIADFGIPKASQVVGDYGAPEQFDALMFQPDHRADLYSLGCVFYFLLTGRPPFAGGSPEEKMRRHLSEEPPPLVQLRPEVPPEAAAIVHRLLAKDPASRFASAAELLAHLDATCVPIALPIEDDASFNIPKHMVSLDHDSGFLTTHAPREWREPSPQAGAANFNFPEAEMSPWSQLTESVLNEGDTVSQDGKKLPRVSPSRRLEPPGQIAGVPIWAIVLLMLGVVLLCGLAVGVVVNALGK